MNPTEHDSGSSAEGGSSSSVDRLREERRQQLQTEEENLLRELGPYMEKFAKLQAIQEELVGFDAN